MKNAILIHGYNGIPKLYLWLKQELQKQGYKVVMPEFPSQEGVQYDIWNNRMEQYKEIIERGKF